MLFRFGSPGYKKQMHNIENVQKRATKPDLDIGNVDYEAEWPKKLKTVYTSL